MIGDELEMKKAWELPADVAYWAAIRVIANATQGEYENQIVPELGAMEALSRWPCRYSKRIEENTMLDNKELNNALDNLNHPRVTPEKIDSLIVGRAFHKLTGVLTLAVLTLENGFTVTGESACASPENYDRDIGEKIAFDNARNKIWALEGYLLKERIHRGGVVEYAGESAQAVIGYSAPQTDDYYMRQNAFQTAVSIADMLVRSGAVVKSSAELFAIADEVVGYMTLPRAVAPEGPGAQPE